MTSEPQAPAEAVALRYLLDTLYMDVRQGLGVARIMSLSLDHLTENYTHDVDDVEPNQMELLADVSYSMNHLVSVLDKVLTIIARGEVRSA